MKRTFTGTCLLAMSAFAFAAGAQTPPQTPPTETTPPTTQAPPATQAPERSMDKLKDISFKGCLQAGTAADSYVLTNIAKVGAPGAQAGTPSEAKPKAKQIALKAGPGVQLKEHVGHTVEVQGSWSQAAGAYAADPTAKAADPTAKKKDKTLEVKSVTMVSATCEAGTN